MEASLYNRTMSAEGPEYDAAMQLYREGRLEEAVRGFDAILASRPAHARAVGARGLALCHLRDFERGLAAMREAVRLAPRDPWLNTILGMVLCVQEQYDESKAFLTRALAIAPADPAALSNLSLVLRLEGDFAGAERAARRALVAQPHFHEAEMNLGLALLVQGKLAEGWAMTCTRPNDRVNLRQPEVAVTAEHPCRLPAPGQPAIVHGEMGLGDTLFMLRFVPELRARGHRLAFWGDERLHALLASTGLFEHFLRPQSVPGPGLPLLWAGDLPHLLGAVEPSRFPSLPLAADSARLEALRRRLAGWGAPPYVGLTWRAGRPRRGRMVLSKEIALERLGAALAGVNATFVSVQRQPAAGETEALAAALGAPLHDASLMNDDLEDALALMHLLDQYVGVSNTNVYLRAGAGRPMHVLVPFPPEWRWLESGERSPWFPANPLYRQERSGDWTAALARLRTAL
jgi:Flp pilus assembly protein TadD